MRPFRVTKVGRRQLGLPWILRPAQDRAVADCGTVGFCRMDLKAAIRRPIEMLRSYFNGRSAHNSDLATRNGANRNGHSAIGAIAERHQQR
jgi:hypothetical protein